MLYEMKTTTTEIKEEIMKTSIVKFLLIFTVVWLLPFLGASAEADDFNRTNLPIPDQPFKGKTGLRPEDSVKDFPKQHQGAL